MKFKLLRAYQQYREQVAFTVYLILIIALAPLIAQLIGDAWEVSQVIKPLVDLVTLVGLSSDVAILGMIGLFVGLLALMSVDPKKRWPALLLWIGFGIISFLLMSGGQVIPDLTETDHLMWLIPGAVFGIILGGGIGAVRLRSLDQLNFDEPRGPSQPYSL